MAETVSDILLNAQLESASILYQDQNITNFSASTGSMDPLTTKHHRMINTEKLLKKESHDVYNVLHPNYTGTLNTDIFSTNTCT